jgi:hypothetical protein
MSLKSVNRLSCARLKFTPSRDGAIKAEDTGDDDWLRAAIETIEKLARTPQVPLYQLFYEGRQNFRRTSK